MPLVQRHFAREYIRVYATIGITLGAAFTLKLDTEIGSIEAGKRADFAILEDDPLAVDPAALKDVTVWGTVVGGRVFPNPNPNPEPAPGAD